MEPSHVLPLRPVPKIQTMFSGLTPRDDRRVRERRDSPFLTARRQARLNLGVNIVPPSGGLVGHKVIATIYSQKTYTCSGPLYSHSTLFSGARVPGLGADRRETRASFRAMGHKPLNNPPFL
jgi:hypothetical protein